MFADRAVTQVSFVNFPLFPRNSQGGLVSAQRHGSVRLDGAMARRLTSVVNQQIKVAGDRRRLVETITPDPDLLAVACPRASETLGVYRLETLGQKAYKQSSHASGYRHSAHAGTDLSRFGGILIHSYIFGANTKHCWSIAGRGLPFLFFHDANDTGWHYSWAAPLVGLRGRPFGFSPFGRVLCL